MERATCPKNTESCYGGDPANDRVCALQLFQRRPITQENFWQNFFSVTLLSCPKKIIGSHRTQTRLESPRNSMLTQELAGNVSDSEPRNTKEDVLAISYLRTNNDQEATKITQGLGNVADQTRKL